jgi:hypothetical protein
MPDIYPNMGGNSFVGWVGGDIFLYSSVSIEREFILLLSFVSQVAIREIYST